ncbi:MAG: Ubiquinone/menaquinone biosynthesis C-methyltransferase UbiE [ANME-2 cluster archaeon]|nr:Ubiquinone/menaquinone biosynthesis C-methyltransferase UbiE [ANME-2 cluster archaeon]
MSRIDFSKIAANYEEYSLVQKSAADTLLKLLEIGNGDDVLDLGCGAGNLTGKIREITDGKVTGIDPSEANLKRRKSQFKILNQRKEVYFLVSPINPSVYAILVNTPRLFPYHQSTTAFNEN